MTQTNRRLARRPERRRRSRRRTTEVRRPSERPARRPREGDDRRGARSRLARGRAEAGSPDRAPFSVSRLDYYLVFVTLALAPVGRLLASHVCEADRLIPAPEGRWLDLWTTKAVRPSGRPGVLCFSGAYHGLTYGALAATDGELFRRPFEDQLGIPVARVPYPEPYRPAPEIHGRRTGSRSSRIRSRHN